MPRGLIFQQVSAPDESAPNRVDIACFVGFVGRRAEVPVPAGVAAWLRREGWVDSADASPGAELETLREVPVPIDTWDAFDALYDWSRRPLLAEGGRLVPVPSYLGAAVRAYFAQGGRRCYVVRLDDPWAADAPRAQRMEALERLLPGYRGVASSPEDRRSWRGLAVLHGLPDVSFVCLPDLPDVVAQGGRRLDPEPPVEAFPERFVECSSPVAPPPRATARVPLAAPRCRDESGWWDWSDAVRFAGGFLAAHRRDVQLVAALPLPEAGTRFDRDPAEALVAEGVFRRLEDGGIAGRFVQLAWPWVRWEGSAGLPESLAPPDGLLAGVLARGILLDGAYRSVAGRALLRASALHPALDRAQRATPRPRHAPGDDDVYALEDRVSLFGETPRGLELLSDVTTSGDEQWRHGSVARLFAVVLRAARYIGQEAVFEASNEQLWARLRRQVEAVLRQLWAVGALRGASAAEAYTVACDRSTMSQNDIDSGRIIVHVGVQPSAPIERIYVVLALDESTHNVRIYDPRTLAEAAA